MDSSVAGKGIARTGEYLTEWGKSMKSIGDGLMKADAMASKASSNSLKSHTDPSTAGTAAQGSGKGINRSGFGLFFSSMFTNGGN